MPTDTHELTEHLLSLSKEERPASRRPRRRSNEDVLEHIFRHTVRRGECCIYEHGSAQTYKYGVVRHEGKVTSPHRVVAELLFGKRPGHYVMHACDTPGCINPNHLSYGMPGDNELDKFTKERARPYGVAQLTYAQVTEIVDLHCCGLTNRQIADLTGQSIDRVRGVTSGENYSFWTITYIDSNTSS